MKIVLFTLLFFSVAVAGALFLVNIVKRRETHDKSYLCILIQVDFRCLFLESRGHKAHNTLICLVGNLKVFGHFKLHKRGMGPSFSFAQGSGGISFLGGDFGMVLWI